MDLNSTDADRLAALAALSGDADLPVAVVDLARSALAIVPSCLALRLTVLAISEPITVATPAYSSGAAIARSSLRLEIITGDGGHRYDVVFLAEELDAFTLFRHVRPPQLGSRGDRALSLRIQRLVVDHDLPADGLREFVAAGLREYDIVGGERLVERAVGVLLDHGWALDDASAELQTRAIAAHRSVVEEAKAVLRSVR